MADQTAQGSGPPLSSAACCSTSFVTLQNPSSAGSQDWSWWAPRSKHWVHATIGLMLGCASCRKCVITALLQVPPQAEDCACAPLRACPCFLHDLPSAILQPSSQTCSTPPRRKRGPTAHSCKCSQQAWNLLCRPSSTRRLTEQVLVEAAASGAHRLHPSSVCDSKV